MLLRIVSLLTVSALLFLPLPELWSGSWRGKLLDLGHVPLFAGLVLVWSIPGRSPWRYVLLASVFAGISELVQDLVGRTADWGDFLRGILGAIAAACGLLAWRARRRPTRLIAYLVLAAGLLAWPLFDEGPWLLDAFEGYRDIPVIARFQTTREIRRWAWRQAEVQRVPDPADAESWVGRIDFQPGLEPYPTAAMTPISRDFRGYGWLCFSFEVIGEPLQLAISIRGGPLDDGHTTHFQFNHRYGPGPQIVRMALPEMARQAEGRPLDLGDVRTVQFYVIRPTGVRTILVRRIWLES